MQSIPRFSLAALALAGCALLAPSAAAQQPLTTVRLASGLNRPLYAISPPGDFDRLFVLEQNTADIIILSIPDGTTIGTFLDLTSKASVGGERGLLGLAFHPNYASNGFFYVNYTRAGDGATIVERYSVTANPDVADLGSGVTVIGPISQPQTNHNGGCIAFGPDGKLYVGMGDGGNFNDTGTGHLGGGNGQNISTFLGKMLRLDVDIAFPHIPADNPAIAGTTPSPNQIWSRGLRNPWRFSFDQLTGDLYVADVGQFAIEEVNVLNFPFAGNENYGWRCMEGLSCTGFSGCTCNAPALTLPVHTYNHNFGDCSISGGFVYRGAAIPDLRGTYFFADFCTGRIWSLEWNGFSIGPVTNRTPELAPGGGMSINSVSGFGQDQAGEVYICDFGSGANGQGEIYKIVPESGTGGITYCNGKTNSLGCVPSISSIGYASASATTGFRIEGNDMVPNEGALLVYGVTGRGTLDFHGGTLCVKAPQIRLLPPKSAGTGGTPPCSGMVKVNFNNRIQGGTDPMLIPGQQVNAQWLQRDPANNPPFGDTLTDGLEFVIAP